MRSLEVFCVALSESVSVCVAVSLETGDKPQKIPLRVITRHAENNLSKVPPAVSFLFSHFELNRRPIEMLSPTQAKNVTQRGLVAGENQLLGQSPGPPSLRPPLFL